MQWLSTYLSITPSGTTGWQTVDLTSQGVPANAVVIVLASTASSSPFGIRKVASSDNRTIATYQTDYVYMYGQTDANKQIQLYRSVTARTYLLAGWFLQSEAACFDGIDLRPGSTGWQDIDCSTYVPTDTKFAIFVVYQRGINDGLNFRKKGSTDNRVMTEGEQHEFHIVGLDTNRVCQVYQETASGSINLVGYIFSGISKETALDKSLSSTGSYIDIDLSADAPSTAIAAVLEVKAPASGFLKHSLRKNGESWDYYGNTRGLASTFRVVPLDAGKIFEGKIEGTNVDFWLHGYISQIAAPVAEFSGIPVHGAWPLTVNFTDLSTNTPTSWDWDFGDGTAHSYSQNPSHIYTTVGIRTVTLIATNDGGSDSEIKTNYITAQDSQDATGAANLPAILENYGVSGMNDMLADVPMILCQGGGYTMTYIEGTLPALQINATSIELKDLISALLPILECIGQTEPRMDVDGTLGIMTGLSTLLTGEVFTSNIQFPYITIVAETPQLGLGTASIEIPILALDGTLLAGTLSNASLVLPGLRTGMTVSAIYGASISTALIILPTLILDAFANIVAIEQYQVYAMNLKNLCLSKYSNFNYNSLCKFGGQYYGMNSNGLYLLEGDKDNGTDIEAIVETGKDNLKLNNLKRIVDTFITMKAQGEYTLTLISEEGNEYTYPLVNTNTTIGTWKVDVGKGTRSQYWGLRFKNVAGAKFEVEGIELNIDSLRRRHR